MENELKNVKKVKWYDNGYIISSLLIVMILLIIISSQSLVLKDKFSISLIGSIINHNSVYFVLLVYFVLIKFPFGKRYFNYLNIILLFEYLVLMFTSLITLVQLFTPNGLLSFFLNIVVVLYLVHTVLRDTSFWKEFNMSKSPFNELKNTTYFYSVLVLSLLLLAVNLVDSSTINNVLLSLLDCVYVILFGRFIYLYKEFLDYKKLDNNNEGKLEDVKKKVQDVLDKTDIDDKIAEFANKVAGTASDVIENINSDVNKNSISNNYNDVLDKNDDKEDKDIVVDEDVEKVNDEKDKDNYLDSEEKKEEVVEQDKSVESEDDRDIEDVENKDDNDSEKLNKSNKEEYGVLEKSSSKKVSKKIETGDKKTTTRKRKTTSVKKKEDE